MGLKRASFYLVGIVLAYLAMEGLAWAGERALGSMTGARFSPRLSALTEEQRELIQAHLEGRRETLAQPHPVLGWTNRPDYGRPDGRYHTNSGSLRGRGEYSPSPREGTVRVSAFGDSFTFGSDVADDETWESQLSGYDPRFEVLNFGVSGYGTDQSYLRFLEDGLPYNSDIVIIGFMAENIFRNVNVFRPFYNPGYDNAVFPKPRFALRDGALVLLPNPFPEPSDMRLMLADEEAALERMGRDDGHYRLGYAQGRLDGSPTVRLIKMMLALPGQRSGRIVGEDGVYRVDSEAYRLTLALLEQFYEAALEHGSLPIVLVYPDGPDMRNHRSGGSTKYGPLLRDLELRGLAYIDLMDAFDERAESVPFEDLTIRPWAHYTALANGMVAAHVGRYLVDRGLHSRGRVEALRDEEATRIRTTNRGAARGWGAAPGPNAH